MDCHPIHKEVIIPQSSNLCKKKCMVIILAFLIYIIMLSLS